MKSYTLKKWKNMQKFLKNLKKNKIFLKIFKIFCVDLMENKNNILKNFKNKTKIR